MTLWPERILRLHDAPTLQRTQYPRVGFGNGQYECGATAVMAMFPSPVVPNPSRRPSSATAFEIFRDEGAVWNLDACIAHMVALAERQGSLMDELLDHVYHLRGSPRLDDDFSIIEARLMRIQTRRRRLTKPSDGGNFA
jgi:hypothetical protein